MLKIDTETIRPKNYNHEQISEQLDSFDNVKVIYNDNGTVLKTANYKAARFFLTENSFAINFNPNKFIYGENALGATFDCYSQTLVQLQDLLGINLMDATVTRVDVFADIITLSDPKEYLRLLSSYSCSKKVSFEEQTITFLKWNSAFKAYAKVDEMKAKKVPLTEEQSKLKLLRIELSLTKQIKRLLDVKELTAEMLLQRDIIEKLASLWCNSFLKIKKVVRPQASLDCSNTKSMVMSLANHGVEAIGGVDVVIDHFDTIPYLQPTQRYRLMQKLFKVACANPDTSTQALLDELSEKVQWIAANAA